MGGLLVLATVRDTVADYLGALLFVYSLLVIAYVLSSFLFALGVRPGYNRYLDAVLGFLRDVCEPFLRIFRRFIPMVGPFDLSPIVALLVLRLVGGVLVTLVRGA